MPANLETWPKPRKKKPNYDNESRTYILHLHPLLLTIFCFLLCQCINILVNSKSGVNIIFVNTIFRPAYSHYLVRHYIDQKIHAKKLYKMNHLFEKV